MTFLFHKESEKNVLLVPERLRFWKEPLIRVGGLEEVPPSSQIPEAPWHLHQRWLKGSPQCRWHRWPPVNGEGTRHKLGTCSCLLFYSLELFKIIHKKYNYKYVLNKQASTIVVMFMFSLKVCCSISILRFRRSSDGPNMIAAAVFPLLSWVQVSSLRHYWHRYRHRFRRSNADAGQSRSGP